MTNIILNDIIIYPIKSLAGVHVDNWQVVATGLQYDRQWMLIDNDGHFLSQRVLPKMALIKTALCETDIILSAPMQTDLKIPLQATEGDNIDCIIWKDTCTAKHISFEADNWFSDFLGHACRLVYMPENSIRSVDNHYAQLNDRTAFSDGFPFLLVSENSLNALNKIMPFHLDMRRFRPNLIVSGCESYAEDTWREINIGNIDFRLPKPCSRCSIPTINPDTAEINKDVLTKLNQVRKWNNKVYFGQNALHNQTGLLKIGANVQIKLTGEKQPPLI